MNYLIDSSAWIEYFIGSNKGKRLKSILENEANSFTTIEVCLAEIRNWTLKNKQNFENILSTITSRSNIGTIQTKEWIDAAEERFQKRKKIKNFGLVDALLLVKQKYSNAKIVTSDWHFKGIKNVYYIGD